jgi:hypothetical protein
MNRRNFVLFLSWLGIGSVATATPVPERKKDRLLVYRGRRVSIFERDGMEIVVAVGRLSYDSTLDHFDGYKRERTPISWTVRFSSDRIYAGGGWHEFFGSDAREKAEEAARTWVLGSLGGWPTFVSPDRIGKDTYGAGGLPVVVR